MKSISRVPLLRHGVCCAALLFALSACLPGQTKTRRPASAKQPASAKPAAAAKSAAATKFDPASGLPLLALRVEGAKRISTEKVSRLAGLTNGKTVNQEILAAAHQRLLDTGLYESVSYRFERPANQNGYIATFEVIETELYYPIRLEDLPLALEDVHAYLRSHDPAYDGNAAATEPGMKRYAKLLEGLLKEHGHPIAVRGQVWAEAGGDLSVMFRPDTNIPSISDIRFEGSEVIEPLELRRIVIQTATGILYTEDRLRQVVNNEVLPAYWAIGYLAAKFTTMTAVPMEEEKGVRVTVKVEEGEEFTMREARILTREYSEEELLELVKFPVGETALWTRVASGVKDIQAKCKRDGFINAKVTIEPRIDEANAQVDLTIVMDEGPRFVFRELKIEGLDLVTEAEVRKLWSMQPGKPFNGLYPDFFLQQLKERQLMDGLGDTRAKVDLDEQKHEAVVTLQLKPIDRSAPRRVPLVRPQ